jgi:hypothetical protein
MRRRNTRREIVKAILQRLLLLICYSQRVCRKTRLALPRPRKKLQAALGASADGLKPQNLGAEAQMCVGQVGALKVILRLASRTDTSAAKEAKGIEIAKKMGAQGGCEDLWTGDLLDDGSPFQLVAVWI